MSSLRSTSLKDRQQQVLSVASSQKNDLLPLSPVKREYSAPSWTSTKLIIGAVLVGAGYYYWTHSYRKRKEKKRTMITAREAQLQFDNSAFGKKLLQWREGLRPVIYREDLLGTSWETSGHAVLFPSKALLLRAQRTTIVAAAPGKKQYRQLRSSIVVDVAKWAFVEIFNAARGAAKEKSKKTATAVAVATGATGFAIGPDDISVLIGKGVEWLVDAGCGQLFSIGLEFLFGAAPAAPVDPLVAVVQKLDAIISQVQNIQTVVNRTWQFTIDTELLKEARPYFETMHGIWLRVSTLWDDYNSLIMTPKTEKPIKNEKPVPGTLYIRSIKMQTCYESSRDPEKRATKWREEYLLTFRDMVLKPAGTTATPFPTEIQTSIEAFFTTTPTKTFVATDAWFAVCENACEKAPEVAGLLEYPLERKLPVVGSVITAPIVPILSQSVITQIWDGTIWWLQRLNEALTVISEAYNIPDSRGEIPFPVANFETGLIYEKMLRIASMMPRTMGGGADKTGASSGCIQREAGLEWRLTAPPARIKGRVEVASASYGTIAPARIDRTTMVRAWMNNEKLYIPKNHPCFDIDPFPGIAKSFRITYYRINPSSPTKAPYPGDEQPLVFEIDESVNKFPRSVFLPEPRPDGRPCVMRLLEATYGSKGVVRADVTDYIRKKIDDSGTLDIPSVGICEAFTDPAPSATKTLRISYKIKTKTADAETLVEENAIEVKKKPDSPSLEYDIVLPPVERVLVEILSATFTLKKPIRNLRGMYGFTEEHRIPRREAQYWPRIDDPREKVLHYTLKTSDPDRDDVFEVKIANGLLERDVVIPAFRLKTMVYTVAGTDTLFNVTEALTRHLSDRIISPDRRCFFGKLRIFNDQLKMVCGNKAPGILTVRYRRVNQLGIRIANAPAEEVANIVTDEYGFTGSLVLPPAADDENQVPAPEVMGMVKLVDAEYHQVDGGSGSTNVTPNIKRRMVDGRLCIPVTGKELDEFNVISTRPSRVCGFPDPRLKFKLVIRFQRVNSVAGTMDTVTSPVETVEYRVSNNEWHEDVLLPPKVTWRRPSIAETDFLLQQLGQPPVTETTRGTVFDGNIVFPETASRLNRDIGRGAIEYDTFAGWARNPPRATPLQLWNHIHKYQSLDNVVVRRPTSWFWNTLNTTDALVRYAFTNMDVSSTRGSRDYISFPVDLYGRQPVVVSGSAQDFSIVVKTSEDAGDRAFYRSDIHWIVNADGAKWQTPGKVEAAHHNMWVREYVACASERHSGVSVAAPALPRTMRNGTTVRSNDGKVWLIYNNRRHLVPNAERTLAAMGWSPVSVDTKILETIRLGPRWFIRQPHFV